MKYIILLILLSSCSTGYVVTKEYKTIDTFHIYQEDIFGKRNCTEVIVNDVCKIGVRYNTYEKYYYLSNRLCDSINIGDNIKIKKYLKWN